MIGFCRRWFSPGPSFARIPLLAFLLAGGVAGCARKPAAAHAVPARSASSEASSRQALTVTIYNQGFGVVRERRRLSLGKGRVELEFRDVAAQLEPNTVHLRAVDAADDLSVLEQNYRYDLLSPEKLLEKHVGKRIRVYRYDERTGVEQVKEAELLSAEQGVVLRIDGQISYGVPGRFAFPNIPPDLVEKPTLVWLLDSRAARQDVEVTYLTRGLNWSADYVLALDAKDERVDLTGWVTLSNESGTSYDSAELKLVAGDVQRSTPEPAPPEVSRGSLGSGSVPRAPSVRQESLFEYHLYTLERPTSIRDKEKKQVALLEAKAVSVQKKLVLRGAEHLYRGRHGELEKNRKIGVFLQFANTEQNRLGMPLPRGTVRVYKADQSGGMQFVGEDAIEHTPRDERVRIRLGDAFDVVADKKQLSYSALFECAAESEWELRLRNHKDRAERLEVYEPAGGDWEILSSSHPARRDDAHTFAFDLALPARGEVLLRYRVRVRWC
jgi:hypothetical protein